MSAAIELEGIAKEYPGPDGGAPLVVLHDISLKLDAGASLAVTGPSGSGKTTLLNILGTLDRPTRGQVHVDGRDLTKLDETQLADFRSRRIGFVFQSHHLLPQCTVLENVLVPTLARPKSERGGTPERAKKLLERVGLSARLGHRPSQLSGGERQRVAVVRALINSPALLLADEPTGALDGASATGLADLLVELNKETGITLVVVTHATALATRMSRQLELRAGALSAEPRA